MIFAIVFRSGIIIPPKNDRGRKVALNASVAVCHQDKDQYKNKSLLVVNFGVEIVGGNCIILERRK